MFRLRTLAPLFILLWAMLLFIGCGGKEEAVAEVPATPVEVKVTKEVQIPIEVTREVPVTVEVTREIPVTTEVAQDVPLTITPDQQERPWNERRIERVRDRGYLICASRNDVPGWGWLDDEGNYVGFDIDLCRAVAAAVLGDPRAIQVRLISAAERGPAILSGEVDLLVRTITWTASRDAGWGNYAQTMFYDGQGFMIREDLGLSSAMELKGRSVCVASETTTELWLHEFSNKHGLDIEVLPFEWTSEVLLSYESGECDAITNDHSLLWTIRTVLDEPDEHMILPEYISEEPLGPVVPHGDDQWFDIVKTVMAILIYGEVYGITSDTVPAAATGITAVDRFLGFHGSFGQDRLALSQTMAQDVLMAVGNYGEVYSRNLDSRSISIPREGSRNALWSDAPCEDCPKGGQIYAAPLR